MRPTTMVGWLNRDNVPSVDGGPDNQKTGKEEGFSDMVSEENRNKKVVALLDDLITAFLKDFFGPKCFRPLSSVVGAEQKVDLFELHVVVKNRGGYVSVSKNGGWGLVAADCGLEFTSGYALKSVYVKYLDKLDRWLRKILKDNIDEDLGVEEEDCISTGPYMDRHSQLKLFLSDKAKKEGFVDLKSDVKSVNQRWGKETIGRNMEHDTNQFSIKNGSGNELKSSLDKKRKRECYFDMLSWIHKIAKDPCDCAIEPLPERHKWKIYGAETPWKQILSAREAMLSKKNGDASYQQSAWQRYQKMHPSMYEDDQCSYERLRCSQRLIFAKDSSQKRVFQESTPSDFQSDDDKDDKLFDSTVECANFCGNQRRKKRIPIGSSSQAELPDFVGECYYQSDSKWLGTRIWPLVAGARRSCLIERDPIGKGRLEMCGCEHPGSLECVKFHVREKRVKLKLEIGSAYSTWRFDNMGELVAVSWICEDESKFQEIVTRSSSDKYYFWDEIFERFPKRGRAALVSYYFNVFLLRRRGCQNRSGTGDIDSDDEGSEFGPIGNWFGKTSIFCSTKKPHSGVG